MKTIIGPCMPLLMLMLMLMLCHILLIHSELEFEYAKIFIER